MKNKSTQTPGVPMGIAKRNLLVISVAWISWMVLAATDALVSPNEWLRPVFFVSAALFLMGSLWANLRAFPTTRPESLQIALGLALGVVVATVASVLGVTMAVNFKLLLGGTL